MLPAQKATPAFRRKLSILLVDDHVDTVLTLAAILRDEGHRVHTCADARQAVDLARRHGPDLCILDLVMPAKSGFDIARELRAAYLVPMLVALSGALTGPDDEARARAAGFNYFIVKSSDSSELVGLIDRIAAADGPPAAA
jgi:CheY-like chemotaxis protein